MKNLILLMVVVLLFSMTSCGAILNGDSISGNIPAVNNGTTSCNHVWSPANCTEPKSCSKCGITQGEALGHTTESGACSRCGENFSKWELGEYEDEFDRPTGKKYIIADAYGTFSNSATTDSTLYAALQIDEENIGIMLLEYGNLLLKGTFDYENYNITILDDNDTKHYFTGTIYKSGARIYFDDDDRAEIISLLRNNDTIMIYLKSTKYSISTYLFTIETAGFDSMYKAIS